jgi:hypothetical protein
MRCPHCPQEGPPLASGPYDLTKLVTGVVFFVCPGCDRYTAAAIQPPRTEPKVNASRFPKAA